MMKKTSENFCSLLFEYKNYGVFELFENAGGVSETIRLFLFFIDFKVRFHYAKIRENANYTISCKKEDNLQ